MDYRNIIYGLCVIIFVIGFIVGAWYGGAFDKTVSSYPPLSHLSGCLLGQMHPLMLLMGNLER